MANWQGDRAGSARRIIDLGLSQRGLASCEQLDELGFGRSSRQRARESGRLLAVRRGVLCLPGAAGGFETDVLAAILAAGASAGAAASHLCAARLLGLTQPSSRWWTDGIELTSARQLRLPGVRAHRSEVAPLDRQVQWQVPTTSAARTLHDLARLLPEQALGSMLDEALRRRLATIRHLEAYLRRHAGLHGGPGQALATLARLVRERDGRPLPANQWEAAMFEMWKSLRLPEAVPQHWVWTPYGSYRPDLAILDRKIAVDWNGYGYHGRRSNFDWDSNRRGHMIEVGWLPLDFTTRSTPEHVVRTVLAAYRQRPPAPPAGPGRERRRR